MRIIATMIALFAASPALASTGLQFSLHNTNFVVIVAFLLFIAVLIYVKVPGLVAGMLDKRAEGIQAELHEARKLREEAQSVLASYERKQKEVAEHAERIVTGAKEEARLAAEQAKEDLKVSIKRRLAAAQEQIASAQSSAVKEVRDQAIQIAVGAAREVIAKQMTAADGNKLIDDAIGQVDAKLH
ncbi:F0F1 ATP synthase subunit B [Aquicoccus sp. G2-2]|jgi:F-type H+-transporting ATPase subunit b|uniref:F0F1 ATP synthase subunit B n=1 Tax=Aquicoccus sp. G2-2 TaxID=3092120 RepID=UPI002ADF83D2|nr:F0F1 ATP synthase subunit B [Aquicoccus sp. G2-2]MEA1115175.1 F0F1 ATP synthase subunit B [Aquicoccus sp. G2-2]